MWILTSANVHQSFSSESAARHAVDRMSDYRATRTGMYRWDTPNGAIEIRHTR
jgi:hypothetical protein